MTDAERWRRVEPLMKQLAERADAHGEMSIMRGLAKAAGEIYPKTRAPAMLDNREIVLRLPKLREMVKSHILHIDAEGRPPKDDDHYIFECALKVFYGDDIFDWYNKANTGE